MWWHRCDSLKCLLCLWKGLWTNECELLATPAYKRCICVRQRKGPASVMGDGASAYGMWCLGERARAEQMQSVYLANQTCWSPTDVFTQQLNMQIHPFLSDMGLCCWLQSGWSEQLCWSACTFFFYVSACLFSSCRSISCTHTHTHPTLFLLFLFFIFVIGVINGGRGGLAWRPVFQWPF